MTYEYDISAPIAELLASQNEEIAKYKRLESQRRGTALDWPKASAEWFEKHFADWAREQRRLVDADLSMTDESLGLTSRQAVQELQPQ